MASLLSRPDILPVYLDDCAGKPRAWGRFDCALFVADWVVLCAGTDPAAWARGKYHNRAQKRAALARGGGLGAIFERGASEACLSPQDQSSPSLGAVGLVGVQAGKRLLVAGAISLGGGRVATLHHGGGLVLAPAKFLRVWA